jgi:hypothetical protein
MISTLFLIATLNAPVETNHVEVKQLSPVSFECVCHSDDASIDFDCSASCSEATQAYSATHASPPAESCNVNPDNCVEVMKIGEK